MAKYEALTGSVVKGLNK